MERIIAWWVHNPVAANLLMVGIVLAGFLGFKAMEREAFPQITPNRLAGMQNFPLETFGEGWADLFGGEQERNRQKQ